MFKKFFQRALPLAVAAGLMFPIGLPVQRPVYAAETQAAVSQNVTATVENGTIRGFAQDGVNYFRGIPYAKPPIGELRWKPPVKPDKWQGELDATEYRSEAAQTGFLGVFATPGGSEDCLYLNVAVPERRPGDPEKYPVFVWIHGGALIVGAGSDYDPTLMAKEGRAVVVTLNYRLGVFGYFAHPALDAGNHASVNYGVMDQIAALEWVRKNIEKFGGDKDDVTIAGESSGGQSAQILMASPKAKGLFKNVIVMSGPVMYTDGHSVSKEEAEVRGIGLAKALGLENATADELRALSTEDILKVADKFAFNGMITRDGEYLPTSVAEAFRAGRINGERFVAGNVRHEGSFFLGLMEAQKGGPLSEADYRAALESVGKGCNMSDFADKALIEYPISEYGSPSAALAQFFTDYRIANPIYRAADMLDDYIPVYYYEFYDPTNPQYMRTSFPQGSAHTYELPYLFPGFHGSSDIGTALNKDQQKLAVQMVKLWTGVSKFGETNLWQRFDEKDAKYLLIGQPTPRMKDMKDYKKRHHFDFWQNIAMY